MVPLMSRVRRLALLLLVALWLPVTLHCELENVGLLASVGECADSEDACCDDTACFTVEEALFKDPAPILKLTAPEVSACLVCLAVNTSDIFSTESALSPARHAPPPELRATWQFVRRAAPPARAPSLNS